MINKKIIILAIFLVSLLTISAVSAMENTTDDICSVNDITEVNSLSDNIVSAGNGLDDNTSDQDVLESSEIVDEISSEDIGNDSSTVSSTNTDPMYPSASDYSVNVSNSTISSERGGSIKMTIAPDSSHGYTYYYYLKVYDSDNNEVISETYSNIDAKYSETYTIAKNQLTFGTYTIKIINYIDEEVMSMATLKVKSSKYPYYTDYSVSVVNATVGYDSENSKYMVEYSSNSIYYSASIKTTISPASGYDYKYYYYLKVYDSNNNLKASKLVSGTTTDSPIYTNLDEYKLGCGNYTIKVINYIDGEVMNTAKLSILPFYPNASDYSVSVSDSFIGYKSGEYMTTYGNSFVKEGDIRMTIIPSSNSYYNYYYYIKVYDSNNNERISQKISSYGGSNYYNGYSINPYITVDEYNLGLGNYTIKIINYFDREIMCTANLTIVPFYPSASDYSVSVSNVVVNYGSTGSIIMNIVPANASSSSYKHYYYMKVYDSNNNVKISKLYGDTTNVNSKSYTIKADELSSGDYTIKIINYKDNQLMGAARLTIKSEYPPASAYSVIVSNSTIYYESGGTVNMSVNRASGYKYDYFFDMQVCDSNNKQKLLVRYISTMTNPNFNHVIKAHQLPCGNYTINIINYGDNKVMNTAKLTVISEYPSASDYSVNIYDSTIDYDSNEIINMSITPAVGDCKYAYNYYLRVYDSNNNEKISELFSSTEADYSVEYNINPYQLNIDPGIYTIKIVNGFDNQTMDTAKLIVKNSTPIYPSASDYSVSISNSTTSYGSTGYIAMDIVPASGYKFTYAYYLKVYDSDNELISELYRSNTTDYSNTYTINVNQLSVGTYDIKVVNYEDNVVMSSATLTVKSAYPSASDYSVSVYDSTMSYGSKGIINMHITSASSFTYKYAYYLKVYDSNNNEIISQGYSNTYHGVHTTYDINANQLSCGIYTVKILNREDGELMSTSTLTVKNSTMNSPYSSDYSVWFYNYDGVIDYEASGVIKMAITPAYSFTYKYDYTLQIYDSNNNLKTSRSYSGTRNDDTKTYTINEKQFAPGTYTMKIINSADNDVMSIATFIINPSPTIPTYPSSLDYSVNVSNTVMNGGYTGSIKMNISPSANSIYKYYYYLKVYDSNNNEMISELYYGTSDVNSMTYSVGANQMGVGNYTIKIINYDDSNVMNSATLTVKSPYPLSSDYSVTVSNSTMSYGSSGSIKMNVTPATSNYKYYYYLKVYDSNNVEKISELYSGTTNVASKTYTISANKLSVGTYTIKIVNYEDNVVMSSATLTVKSAYPSASDYSVSVLDSTMEYGSSGSIKMNVTPATSNYKYYYYLKVYDSNNVEKISELYSGTTNVASKTYTISANKLSVGTYTIKIVNYEDNVVMTTAKLTVQPSTYPYSSDYSVSVCDLSIDYDSNGIISMSILPASSSTYTYYYYLKVYDSNNNEKVSELYSGISTTYSKTYSVNSNQLNPGTYTVKIINYADNNVMSIATLTVKSPSTIPTNPDNPEIISKEPTRVFAKSNNVIYGNNLDFVLDNYKSGLVVSVKINGITKNYVTSNGGHIYIPTTGLGAGTYSATITFNGNSLYEKSTSVIKVTIKKATPKITAKAKTFKKSVKTKKYTITLKDNKGKAMKNTKVTIKVNKKTYSAKTNSKGVATFKITKLTKKGSFTSVITYNGNKYYNKVTKKVKIKIK